MDQSVSTGYLALIDDTSLNCLPPPTPSLLTSAIDRFDPLKQTESLEPTPSQSKSLVAYQFDLENE
jgi:hypothetical protein